MHFALPVPIRRLAVASLMLIPTAATVRAQTPSPTPVPLLGIIAGLNWSNMVTYGSASSNSAHRGTLGGIQLVLPINRWFAIQPEVLYSTKGAQSSAVQTDSTPSVTATLTMNYIEIPVLARFEIPISDRVSSLFYAGPAISFRRTCNYEVDTADTLSGATSSIVGCDKLTTATGQTERLNTVDGGVIAGLGLALIQPSGMVFTATGRCSFGLLHVSPDATDRHVVISLLAGIALPLGR